MADPRQTAQQLQELLRTAPDLDPKEARDRLSAITGSNDFSALTDLYRHTALSLLATLDMQLGDMDAAGAHARTASEMAGANAQDWEILLAAAENKGNEMELAHCLAVIATRWPDRLADFKDRYIVMETQDVERLDKANHGEELLRALHEAHWAPVSELRRADWIQRDLATIEIEHNHPDRAAEIVTSIRSPEDLIEMRVDRRFDPLAKSGAVLFDPVEGAHVLLAEARAAAAARPPSLMALNRVAESLMRLGKNDEALALLTSALSKALPADGSASAFDDDDEAIWTLNLRSHILMATGKFDEGFELLERAALRPENGHINVSQVLNLGEANFSFGRPQQALDTVMDVSARDLSDFGALVLGEVRVCSYAQLGNREGVEAELAAMGRIADRGLGPYLAALLCAEDWDGAADVMKSQLADSVNRVSALIAMQNFTLDKPHSAFEALQRERKEKVQQRADVQAALAQVGRSRSWPLDRL